jgi:hypothetical protein
MHLYCRVHAHFRYNAKHIHKYTELYFKTHSCTGTYPLDVSHALAIDAYIGNATKTSHGIDETTEKRKPLPDNFTEQSAIGDNA